MKPQISGRAQDDLAGIYARILIQRGSGSAEEFLEASRAAVDFLVENPQAGPHPTWATRHRTIRFGVIKNTHFLIFHFSGEIGISIERALDGRR